MARRATTTKIKQRTNNAFAFYRSCIVNDDYFRLAEFLNKKKKKKKKIQNNVGEKFMPFTFPTSTNKLQGNSNDTMLQYCLREFALCQIGGEKKKYLFSHS